MNNKTNMVLLLIIFITGCSPKKADSVMLLKDKKDTTNTEKIIRISTVDTIEKKPALIKVLIDAYAKIGYKVELVLLPSQRSIEENLANPNIDAEFARARGAADALPNCIIVPVSLLKTQSVCFIKDKSIKIETLDDLKKYSVGTIRGFPVVEKAMEKYSPKILTTTEQAMKMLNENRVQVVVVIKALGKLTIEGLKLENISITGPPVTEHKIYHYINKRHKNLVPSLTKALSELTGNEIEKD